MKSSLSLQRRTADKLVELAELLDCAYGAPEGDLDNKPDPLDEAIYITLTLQTDLRRAVMIWARLRAAFPTWDKVATARTARVASILREGGLHRQKARTIKRLLTIVKSLTGEFSLTSLHGMTDAEAERFLLRLPGFSWKTARCVLLYSLDRDVLPIDSNAFRILKRTGILAPSAVYRRRSLHDTLQEAVPAASRRALHVNLVVHGQRTCLPHAPRCRDCVVRTACAMRGIPRSSRPDSAILATLDRAC